MGLRGRKLQATLMLYGPENYFTVWEALIRARQQDVNGSGRICVIPAHPPGNAIKARRRRANAVSLGDHYHGVMNLAKGESAGE